ncbi:MAG: hypothetical protein RLZZ618_2230 [Pseudomonadota bacterium]|jgi:uncharacterized BrkB/YihY/UPF0761 family membrane protein
MDIAPNAPATVEEPVPTSLLVCWWVLLLFSVVVGSMAWTTIPVFVDLFRSFGSDLPPFTLFVIEESWRLLGLTFLLLTPTLMLTFVHRISPAQRRLAWRAFAVGTVMVLASLAAVVIGMYLPILRMGQVV